MKTKTLRVISPYDQSLIKEISMTGTAEVEDALTVAHGLFNDPSQWIPAHRRIAILEQTAEIMRSRMEELARLAAQEGGKPLTDSRVEVLRAINGVKLTAAQIAQLSGEQIPMGTTEASENRFAVTVREPIGVVAAISAFNHPLNLIVHQAVTAIAAGCPVLIKPAAATPLSCLALVNILREAELPEGWCQPILCDHNAAEQLVVDERVNYFSFIGSAKVGWYLRSKLSPGTRCALEHGGAAPVIVEEDADFDEMLPALLKGGFYHAGQVCVSVQRIFAHEQICEPLATRLAEMAEQLVVGNPLEESTEVGPLILPGEVDRVEQWVKEAVKSGATLLCGGKRISNTCYAPTVLLNPAPDARVSTSEVFGPVVCIYSYSDRKEAVRSANSLDLHFQASVFTKNLDVAMETVKGLNAAAVMINDHTAFRVDWMPFGGRDASGLGLGGIQYSMHEMTREKLVVIKSKAL